ncbi:methylenetetrahydrofolate reductase C-terminal domain-containing protein [Chloroflexota bacterium]
MITITEQKPLEEVTQSLNKCQKVYLIGCGTCATMLHTGGKSEVLEMKHQLEDAGREVTGWMVIPTACDILTKEALAENAGDIEAADCILVMSCAFGVQTVALHSDKPVYPALNTLFIGKQESPGHFNEICMQCGECVIGQYAGICPVTSCAKGLLCGPCGGSKGGKCEQEPEHDCAWVLIYERLKKLGKLDELKGFAPPKDYNKMKRPRQKEVALP